jgi:thymidylate kinase
MPCHLVGASGVTIRTRRRTTRAARLATGGLVLQGAFDDQTGTPVSSGTGPQSGTTTFGRGTVLVVGPDGSGKTAIVASLVDALTNQGVPVTRAHYRPGVIGRAAASGPVVEPHAGTVRSTPAAAAKLAMLFADFLAGHLGPWRRARRRGVLLLERGWYDQAVDPRRYRLPEWTRVVVDVLGRLLPRPDVVVVLSGDAAQIRDRKPEISEGEIGRQIDAWRRRLAVAGRRGGEVSTTGRAVGESVASVLALLDGGPPLVRVPFTSGRLQLAITPTAAGARAAQIYRPMKWSAAFASTLGLWLSRRGIGRRADPVGTVTAGPHTGAEGIAVMRSSYRDRWIVGRADAEALREIAKSGTLDDDGLRREAAALRVLTERSLRVPTLLFAGESADRFVVRMAAEEPTGTGTDLTTDELVGVCRSLLDLGVTHGDLAPWNILRTDGGLVVIDWEQFVAEHTPLLDLVHYHVQAGALLGRGEPPAVADLLLHDPRVEVLLADPAARRRTTAQAALAQLPAATDDRVRRFREALRHELA